MSTNIERAAEVIHGHRADIAHGEPRPCVEALAAEGLLVTDEQAGLIALGEAVEHLSVHWHWWLHDDGSHRMITPNPFDTFQRIYAEAAKP